MWVAQGKTQEKLTGGKQNGAVRGEMMSMRGKGDFWAYDNMIFGRSQQERKTVRVLGHSWGVWGQTSGVHGKVISVSRVKFIALELHVSDRTETSIWYQKAPCNAPA